MSNFCGYFGPCKKFNGFFRCMTNFCWLIWYTFNFRSNEERKLLPKESQQKLQQISMKDLFKQPAVYVPLVGILVISQGYSFTEAMLEPQMKEALQASQSIIANYFFFLGLSNTAFCAITGVVIGRIKHSSILTNISNAAMAAGLLLTGPVVYLGMTESITTFYISALMIGKFQRRNKNLLN